MFLHFSLVVKCNAVLWIHCHTFKDVRNYSKILSTHLSLLSLDDVRGLHVSTGCSVCKRAGCVTLRKTCSWPSGSLGIMNGRLCKHSQVLNIVPFHNQLPQKRCQAPRRQFLSGETCMIRLLRALPQHKCICSIFQLLRNPMCLSTFLPLKNSLKLERGSIWKCVSCAISTLNLGLIPPSWNLLWHVPHWPHLLLFMSFYHQMTLSETQRKLINFTLKNLSVDSTSHQSSEPLSFRNLAF